MAETLEVWIVTILLFGGILTLLIGHLWGKAAPVARFFLGRDIKRARAERTFLVGAAMFVIGLALLYLWFGHATSPSTPTNVGQPTESP